MYKKYSGMVPVKKGAGLKLGTMRGEAYTIETTRNNGCENWPFKYRAVLTLDSTGMTIEQASDNAAVHASECCQDELMFRLKNGITTDAGLSEYYNKQPNQTA